MIADTEAIYDQEIAPLMDRVIALCRQHNIPHLITFQLTGEDDVRGPMFCTTAQLPQDADATLLRCMDILDTAGANQPVGRGGTPAPKAPGQTGAPQ